MTQAAPGWYDDGAGRLRWWDGAAWSGDVLDPTVAAAAPAAASAPSDRAEQPEEFPWMREAAGRERLAAAGTGATATATLADPIRSLQVEQPSDGIDPVVAWARQQAAAQEAAVVEQPETRRGTIIEAPARPRRRALPWVLGGVLGAVVLAGAGGAVLALAGGQAAGDPGAASVVRAYNDLWAGADCSTVDDIGTEAFIADLGWSDCAALAENQRTFLQSYEDYRVTIEETVVQGDIAWVDTSERFRVPGGEEERVDRYRYELVRDGDGWLIDALSAR